MVKIRKSFYIFFILTVAVSLVSCGKKGLPEAPKDEAQYDYPGKYPPN
jgi:predicted small lipoprotein YifL